MGRLIDADALLKKFDDTGIQITFDLPVEEILGEGVDIDDFSMLVQDAIRAYRKMVIETIKEHPTAYSVEAVVAAIKTKHCKKCRNIWQSRDGNKYCKDIKCEIEGVCEIVRNGGKE